jgi:hypothetical protein
VQQLLNCGAIKRLVFITAHCRDDKVVNQAFIALNYIAYHSTRPQLAALVEFKMVSILLRKVRSFDALVRTEALCMTTNLMSNAYFRGALVDAGIVGEIVEVDIIFGFQC